MLQPPYNLLFADKPRIIAGTPRIECRAHDVRAEPFRRNILVLVRDAVLRPSTEQRRVQMFGDRGSRC